MGHSVFESSFGLVCLVSLRPRQLLGYNLNLILGLGVDFPKHAQLYVSSDTIGTGQ